MYPTIAASDAFFAATSLAAARVAYQGAPSLPAWIGFALVAFAATVGTLRFGFAERLLAKANSDMAGLTAYVGLPLVGLSFALRWGVVQSADACAFAVGCAAVHTCSASLSEGGQELLKIALNVVFFLAPIVGYGASRRDAPLLGAAGLFALAGLAVGGSKDRALFGVLRANLFHYLLGLANYGIARGLVA